MSVLHHFIFFVMQETIGEKVVLFFDHGQCLVSRISFELFRERRQLQRLRQLLQRLL